jgi:hypothetical protein
LPSRWATSSPAQKESRAPVTFASSTLVRGPTCSTDEPSETVTTPPLLVKITTSAPRSWNSFKQDSLNVWSSML